MSSARKQKIKTRVEMGTEIDPDSADEAMPILCIAHPNPERQGPQFDGEQLLIEPWAVQAALSRRRGGQVLTEREVAEIRRCTRDADTLRWPRRPGK